MRCCGKVGLLYWWDKRVNEGRRATDPKRRTSYLLKLSFLHTIVENKLVLMQRKAHLESNTLEFKLPIPGLQEVKIECAGNVVCLRKVGKKYPQTFLQKHAIER